MENKEINKKNRKNIDQPIINLQSIAVESLKFNCYNKITPE